MLSATIGEPRTGWLEPFEDGELVEHLAPTVLQFTGQFVEIGFLDIIVDRNEPVATSSTQLDTITSVVEVALASYLFPPTNDLSLATPVVTITAPRLTLGMGPLTEELPSFAPDPPVDGLFARLGALPLGFPLDVNHPQLELDHGLIDLDQVLGPDGPVAPSSLASDLVTPPDNPFMGSFGSPAPLGPGRVLDRALDLQPVGPDVLAIRGPSWDSVVDVQRSPLNSNIERSGADPKGADVHSWDESEGGFVDPSEVLRQTSPPNRDSQPVAAATPDKLVSSMRITPPNNDHAISGLQGTAHDLMLAKTDAPTPQNKTDDDDSPLTVDDIHPDSSPHQPVSNRGTTRATNTDSSTGHDKSNVDVSSGAAIVAPQIEHKPDDLVPSPDTPVADVDPDHLTAEATDENLPLDTDRRMSEGPVAVPEKVPQKPTPETFAGPLASRHQFASRPVRETHLAIPGMLASDPNVAGQVAVRLDAEADVTYGSLTAQGDVMYHDPTPFNGTSDFFVGQWDYKSIGMLFIVAAHWIAMPQEASSHRRSSTSPCLRRPSDVTASDPAN